MINNIKSILENHLSWMKNDLIFLICLNLAVSLFFYFMQPHFLIQLIAFGILLFKSVKFVNMYSLLPGQTSVGDRFSWKFLQGLPFNKRELLISLGLSRVLVFIPLFLWIALFWNPAGAMMSKENTFENYNILKIIFNAILLCLLSGISSVAMVINYPRVEYRKRNSQNQLIGTLRMSLQVLVIILYALALMIFLKEKHGVDLFSPLQKGIEFSIQVILSWWFPFILMLVIPLTYVSTLSIWLDEKKSYRPIEWKPVKEWSLITVFLLLLIYPVTQYDFKTPRFYRDSRLLKAVYQKNYGLIEKELKARADFKAKNHYGFTPMLAAVHEGDLKMVRLLEHSGVGFEGSLKSVKDYHNGFDAFLLSIDSKNVDMVHYLLSKGFEFSKKNESAGFYPIHFAASKCNSQILDLLIKKGADIHVKNDNGETPLLVAVRTQCFSNTVALKEAGAAFDVADKNGKKAIDYFVAKKGEKEISRDREFTYFIEKHSRSPAGE